MSTKRDFYIWDGIYENWSDAPVVGDAFNDKKWLVDQAANINAEIAALVEGHTAISASAISRDYVLPVVTALCMPNSQTLKILDFGGGLAQAYPLVMGCVSNNERIEFHVVEGSGICELGRMQFQDRSNLFFHTGLPAHGETFDIIHAGRSFQYVDDWRGCLSSFASFKPRYLVLAGLLAGDIKSFVSTQNYYGCKIPMRFLNRDELINAVEELGFRLVYKSFHLSKRLGKEGPLPMENFPKEFRLEHPCQLLFERSQE